MPNTGDIVRASDFEAVKPQLNIGTVTTGAAGSNASASITGTSPNFKLNLTIPRGNTGATGPQGPSGTYTGPLKPTNSYWRSAIPVLNGKNVCLPSGGTWAWHLIVGTYSSAIVTNGYVGVNAGGTQLANLQSYPGDAYRDVAQLTLCWRIQ